MEKKSTESFCTETSDLDRSYFPEQEYVFLPAFRVTAHLYHPKPHCQWTSLHVLPPPVQSMLNIALYFPFLRSALAANTSKQDRRWSQPSFRLPSTPQETSTFPCHLHYLAILPMHPSYPFPPELPPHFTYLAEVQSHCSQAILSTKSAICFPSKEDLCVPKILTVFFSLRQLV